MTQRAKLFEREGRQAVLLPEEFRFEGMEEVSIYREEERVILVPVRRRKWSREFLELAGSAPDFPYTDEPYCAKQSHDDHAEVSGTTL